MWPHYDAVAQRSSKLFADYKQGLDIAKYATTGQEDRRVAPKGKRADSPGKNTQTSTKGGSNNWKGQQDSQHEVTPQAQVQTQQSSGAKGADIMCGSHLKSPEDLTGFPVFPQGTKSSLMKNLSKEIWAKYAD